MKTLVGERGQVTIPKSIRRLLGLRQGMRLEVTVEDGAVVLRKPDMHSVLEAWEGTASTQYESTDAFIASVRDETGTYNPEKGDLENEKPHESPGTGTRDTPRFTSGI
jgi:AbrB family looped-hinge helix DNA binding protein